MKSKKSYYEKLLNKKIEVIVESKIIDEKYISSVSSNYINIRLPLDEYKEKIGELHIITIVKVDDTGIYGS